MVELIYPQSSPVYYTKLEGYFIGPYFPSGIQDQDYIKLHINDLDFITEHHGIYGENNVDHRKVEGLIIYQPAFQCLESNPTDLWPWQVHGSLFQWNTPIEMNYEYGVAVSGTSRMVSAWNYGGECRLWTTCTILDKEWSIYSVNLKKILGSPLCALNWTHRRYHNFRLDDVNTPSRIIYDRDTRTVSSPTFIDDAWWETASHESIVGFPEIYNKVPSTTFKYGLSTHALRYLGEHWSPVQIKRSLLTKSRSLSFDEFPLDPIPDGEIAYEAAKKIRASDVNLLEFFADIRKPWQLIPKLKNLQSLKGLAGNYLTVDYGILPTIDDLHSIYRAVVNRKPYLDKNGYSVYTSYNRRTVAESDQSYCFEQRAKLAVADDVDFLLAMARRLDDFGAYPRFKYMWDLVPFSFVIDWFVDIGDFLERIDTRLQNVRLPIRYATLSHRKSASTILDDVSVPYSGNLSLVHYHRWVTDHCPAPPLSLQGSSDPLSHIIDGGALIIQRIK